MRQFFTAGEQLESTDSYWGRSFLTPAETFGSSEIWAKKKQKPSNHSVLNIIKHILCFLYQFPQLKVRPTSSQPTF